MTAKEKDSILLERTWSTEEEIQLFYALIGLKPVGINRHFHMACILERLSRSFDCELTTNQIWNHLNTIYKIDKIDLQEPLPFPNEEREFSLPEKEYPILLTKRRITTYDDKQNFCTPQSIIAVITDNTSKEKSCTIGKPLILNSNTKDLEKKISAKILDIPKRLPKRTRGSMSLESNSPSSTPPPLLNNKRRRI